MIEFSFLLLALIVIKFAADAILNFLNYKHLKKNCGIAPDSLKDVLDVEKLQKLDSYNSEKIRFNIITLIVDLAALLIFLYTPLFRKLILWLDAQNYHIIAAGMFFFFILIILNLIITLPFSAYSDFVIEQKFGFNKYTFKQWIIDNMKSLIIQIVLTAIISLIVFALIPRKPEFDFKMAFYLWAAIACLTIIFAYLVPVIILPFIYKLAPINNEELKNKISEVVEKAGYSASGVFSVDASKRSTHANAGLSGFGKSKKIIIFDTMLDSEKYTHSEIIAVLAHELGHSTKKHIIKQLGLSLVIQFFLINASIYIISADSIYQSFGLEKISYAGLLLAGIVIGNLMFIIQPLSAQLSRKYEYEADAYSAELTGDSLNLISVFKKFATNDLANINPHPFYESIYYSHPSIVKRIARLISES